MKTPQTLREAIHNAFQDDGETLKRMHHGGPTKEEKVMFAHVKDLLAQKFSVLFCHDSHDVREAAQVLWAQLFPDENVKGTIKEII
jgi:hypothetical protein